MKHTTQWLTVNEACELLRVTRATLYNYIRAGKIKSGRIIGKTYINRQSIDDALTAE